MKDNIYEDEPEMKNKFLSGNKKKEDMRIDIMNNSNKIKRFGNDLNEKEKEKEKEKLPTQKEFNDLHYDREQMSNELDIKTRKIKNLEDEIKNLKNKLENMYEHNKDLKNVIKKKNDELDNLNVNLDNMKDEIIVSKSKFNDIILKNKQLIQDYDNLNKDYLALKAEKDNLD